jgi:hypothetical protein
LENIRHLTGPVSLNKDLTKEEGNISDTNIIMNKRRESPHLVDGQNRRVLEEPEVELSSLD